MHRGPVRLSVSMPIRVLCGLQRRERLEEWTKTMRRTRKEMRRVPGERSRELYGKVASAGHSEVARVASTRRMMVMMTCLVAEMDDV